jgi:hypothetical protein
MFSAVLPVTVKCTDVWDRDSNWRLQHAVSRNLCCTELKYKIVNFGG